jgi:hypothetical protein
VGVVHDFAAQELRIYTDAGRTSRPLLIVDGQRLRLRKGHVRRLLERSVDLVPDPAAEEGGGEDGRPQAFLEDTWTWGRLVREGLVEYVDAEEEETTMIAMAIGDLESARLDPSVSRPSVRLFVCLFFLILSVARSVVCHSPQPTPDRPAFPPFLTSPLPRPHQPTTTTTTPTTTTPKNDNPT